MAYDEVLAQRIHDLLDGEPGVTSRKMFGGLGFMVDGHMAVAASGQGGLLLRVDPADSPTLVDGDRITRMEMRGREMDGWLRVATEAVATDEALST